MKQKVFTASSMDELKDRIETAFGFGWLVQQIVVNPRTSDYLAIVYME